MSALKTLVTTVLFLGLTLGGAFAQQTNVSLYDDNLAWSISGDDFTTLKELANWINPYDLKRCVDELLFEAEFYVPHTSSIFDNFSDFERREYFAVKHEFCVLFLSM